MATIKTLDELKVILPKGMFLNPDGERTLSNQINEVVAGYNKERVVESLFYIKQELDYSFTSFFSSTQGKDLSMFHNQTGNLLSLTGYALAYNDTIIYKKNGRFAGFQKKSRAKDSNTDFIIGKFSSLPKNTKMLYFKDEDIPTISLYLFSAATHSSWVNYGLGEQRKDGQPKRGVGWFDKYSEYMYNTFSVALRDERIGSVNRFSGRSGGFKRDKK